ncbi:hypothetical protein CKO35_17295 [Ectothiorhodospira shaposhnikovii]|uniref:YdcF family protein n=1 Tax=Ectothiorhodospira shaposhnikovii TaxID=1054 RepID=UPI001904DDA1|nr:YdcF family protein [Ectothiorhodospira shaposhnikovii]MBK1674996.1 hypothetical protein [Ectothiorhodospira shaposhnikovii]
MLYLDKLLAQLAYPLGLLFLLALLALLLWLIRWRRTGAGVLCLGLAWVWLWSMPVASDALRASLESRFEYVPADALPEADAVVVLGGGINVGPPQWPYPNLGPAADRVWHGARLYHADRAPWVIVSGGSVPWRERERVEAHAMREFLVDLGVPASAVLLETDSATTRGNAVYTARLLEDKGLERVLLVTSALHMERALATFRAAGVEAWPAPTDFEVEPLPADLLRWLPDAQALADSTRALKEYLGLWVYRWRGWAE